MRQKGDFIKRVCFISLVLLTILGLVSFDADSDYSSSSTIEGEFLIASDIEVDSGGVAFDGTNYLQAYLDNSDNYIKGQFISKTGSLVDSPFTIGSMTEFESFSCAVAFDGTNYLIVWSKEFLGVPFDNAIFGQFVSTAGNLIGNEITITPYDHGSYELDLAFGGNDYLLVHASSFDDEIHARFISPDGSVGNDIPVSSEDGSEPTVAFDGTNFLVVWYKDDPKEDVYGRFISSTSGATVGPEFVIDANSYQNGGDHGIAFDGTNYLVTFNENINGEWDIFARLVDTSGNVGDRFAISNESGNHLFPYITFGDNRYLIIWHYFADWPSFDSFDSFGQFYDTSGSAVGPIFSIELFGDNTFAFPVRYDRELDKYFAGALTGTLTDSDLYGFFINIDDSGIDETIGTWDSGIWYRDVVKSKWTKMYSGVPSGGIAAGDFTGDRKADVASIWGNGLWYQDGASLAWTKISGTAPNSLTAGDVTGDGPAEIIGAWGSGIWYYDVNASEWTKMTSSTPTGDIAAGDFTGDGKADVASIWPNGLWYQDGASLDWTKVGSAPNSLTAGDVTGDDRAEIIGSWNSGIWYWDVAESEWTRMTASMPTGEIAAGDFTGDGKADVASCWSNGLWYQNGDTLKWKKVSNTAPTQVTAGDITGD